ncbi:nuclear transport factor 2 family protein [Rhizobium leguminosarum]|uniref:nuclear transport factor 2 family protein n=1 Tax=Rhizobium leguminosarum TaxID=384 RepID=UPI001FD8F315|nr:nuclear transport factor 2 family protein [Rhizobium leguminosarum]
MGDAFAGYLANFETVYHINGQQTVELNGDTATGTAYCLVVLIADEAGKKIKNTSGVTYHDEYVRRDGKWLIAKRTSNFAWRDRQELGHSRDRRKDLGIGSCHPSDIRVVTPTRL